MFTGILKDSGEIIKNLFVAVMSSTLCKFF